jgi:hypothetical protein
MECFYRTVLMDEPGDVEATGAATLGADLCPLSGLPPPENPLVRQGLRRAGRRLRPFPIDPIPDFIPGVGLLDEMVVVPIGVLIVAKMIPRQVMEECQEKAREVAEGEKPVSRVAVVVVVAIWLLCVALAMPATIRSKPMQGTRLRDSLLLTYC